MKSRNIFFSSAVATTMLIGYGIILADQQTDTENSQLNNPKQQNCGLDITVPEWLAVNDDDDNDDDQFDFEIEPLPGEKDTVQITITATADKSPATVDVEITAGASKIEGFWAGTLTIDGEVEGAEIEGKEKRSNKKTSFTVPKGKSGTQTLYIEGINHSDSKDDIKIKAKLVAPQVVDEDGTTYEECRQETEEKSTTAYRLRIKDIPETKTAPPAPPPVGLEIPVTVKHSAIVGVKDAYANEILPDPGGTKQYKWEINGASPPPNTLSIKTYEHEIDDPSKHKRIDLVKADMENATLEHFWRIESNDGKIKLTLTAGAVMIDKTIKTEAKVDPDPNREIYAPVIDSIQENVFRNPNGVGGQYSTNKTHRDWHSRANTDVVILANPAAYDGSGFFNFHKDAIASNGAWRASFSVPAIPAGVPGAAPAKPSYLEPVGGNAPDFFYGYVRLGEALSLTEVGLMTVFPWHNTGHNNIGGEMLSTDTAIRTAADEFWRWHNQVDTVRTSYLADKARIVTTSPAGNMVPPAASQFIEIEFNKPVSQVGIYANANPALHLPNTAGISPGLFKVNGAVVAGATLAPVGADRKKYKLTLPAALAIGVHTIDFAGTRAIDSISFNFEVK